MKDYQAIWTEATAAAQAAGDAKNATLGSEQSRGLDCGFAWIVVRPARGPFIQWCKNHNPPKGHNHHAGGWCFWYSELYHSATQSISVHEAAVRAFADVLIKHGIDCHVDSRLD